MDIDPRGPRFGAVITTVVLAVVLVTGSVWLLARAARRVRDRRAGRAAVRAVRPAVPSLVRPRLGPPASTEPEAPPRFSQGVGMVFAAGGVVCYAAGVTAGGIVFTALALVAAFLNAAFDFCLGCQMYLFIQRNLRVRPSA